MTDLDKILNQVAAAAVSNVTRNDRYREGDYDLTVLRFVMDPKTDGWYYIVDLRVDASRPVAAGVEPNMPGSEFTVMGNLSDVKTSAQKSQKAFVLALLGQEEPPAPSQGGDPVVHAQWQSEFRELCKTLIAGEQPCRGMRIRGTTYKSKKPIQTGKNAGSYFVGINWRHVNQTADQIASNRASLD